MHQSFTCVLLLAFAWMPTASAAEKPVVPVDVAGFAAPAAGEHPRLFFRKADLAGIRQRAETPEGQAIVKRLRFLLDGSSGDSFPTEFNPNRGKQPDGSGKFAETAPPGKTYTSGIL